MGEAYACVRRCAAEEFGAGWWTNGEAPIRSGPMARADEGLKSDALRRALVDALSRNPTRLEDLLARHGGLPGPAPNLKLAAAFGAEVAATDANVLPLLSRLTAEEAEDAPSTFLPIAAAHGWAACIRASRAVEPAWEALATLAADFRASVRLGTLDALISIAHRDGGADVLVSRGLEWLLIDDRELRFGAMAAIVDALSRPSVLATTDDPNAILSYLSRVFAEVAEAPRAAGRSDALRRVLNVLPKAAARMVASFQGGDRGRTWFEGECAQARHPEVRKAFNEAIALLRKGALAQSVSTVDALRKALEESAKPLRDPSRVREGTGRGKRSRRIR